MQNSYAEASFWLVHELGIEVPKLSKQRLRSLELHGLEAIYMLGIADIQYWDVVNGRTMFSKTSQRRYRNLKTTAGVETTR